MTRRRVGWILGGLLLALIAAGLALRSFVVFGPDGPPRQANVAYVETPAQASVQTEITVPIPALQALLRPKIVTGEPVYAGKLEHIPADIIMAMLGLPRIEAETCDAKVVTIVVNQLEDCFRAAARHKPLKRKAEEALCLGKFAANSVIRTKRTITECTKKFVEFPKVDYDVSYAFFVKTLSLAAVDNTLQVTARIDSTLTVPKSVLSFLNGKTTQTCGPSVTAVAQLRPKVASDNTDKSRALGQVKLGLDVRRVKIGPGQPCKSNNTATKVIMRHGMGAVLDYLSGVFQNALRSAVADLPETAGVDPLINGVLSAGVEAARRPLALGPLIGAGRPDVLPPGITPYLTLHLSQARIAQPRIVSTRVGGHILLSPGLTAAPQVSFARPADPPAGFIPLKTGTPPNDRFEVTVVGEIGLQAAQTVLSQHIKDILDAALADKITYKDASVTLYQARERLVIGLEVTGLTWLGLRAKVFLTARPEMSGDRREILLRDVKFDLASSQFLSRVAAFVLESPVEKMIETQAVLPLGGALDPLLETLADTTIQLDQSAGVPVTLGLKLSDLTLEHLWVSNGKILAAVSASGRSRIALE